MLKYFLLKTRQQLSGSYVNNNFNKTCFLNKIFKRKKLYAFGWRNFFQKRDAGWTPTLVASVDSDQLSIWSEFFFWNNQKKKIRSEFSIFGYNFYLGYDFYLQIWLENLDFWLTECLQISRNLIRKFLKFFTLRFNWKIFNFWPIDRFKSVVIWSENFRSFLLFDLIEKLQFLAHPPP